MRCYKFYHGMCRQEGQGLCAWSDNSIPASLGAGVAPGLADGPACRISIVICAIYSLCSEDWQVDEERARRASVPLA